MEEQRRCDKMENHIHSFYFVKIRPSCWDVIDEAENQYTLAQSRIYEEIAKQKALEHKIDEKITRVARLDKRIQENMEQIKYIEQLYKWLHTPNSPVEKTNGFFGLYGKDKHGKDVQTHVREDRKRCQKKLINKGVMDIQFLERVQEELMTSKISGGITSCGKRELHDLVESMAHRIQHGNEKRAHEMKIYQKIKTVNETREFYYAPEVPRRNLKQWYLRLKEHDSNWKLYKQNRINIRLDDIENLKRRKGHKSGAQLQEKLKHVRKNINSLNMELENITSKRNEAYKHANKFGDQTKEMKHCYDEYQSVMTYAKELARTGDVVRLKNLCDSQVDEFKKQWSESKGFRDDYETRKLALKRQ